MTDKIKVLILGIDLDEISFIDDYDFEIVNNLKTRLISLVKSRTVNKTEDLNG